MKQLGYADPVLLGKSKNATKFRMQDQITSVFKTQYRVDEKKFIPA